MVKYSSDSMLHVLNLAPKVRTAAAAFARRNCEKIPAADTAVAYRRSSEACRCPSDC